MDITERVQKELELKESSIKLIHASRLASLGEMSAGIAHEINNPLTIIAGSIGQLNKYKDNQDKFNSKLTSIEKSCERISRIVSGLKKFSRSGDHGDFKDVEFCSIVAEALILTKVKSDKFDTKVTFECGSKGFIYCDEVEIEQVLINLINNAIDAIMYKKDKWVTVTTFERDSTLVVQVIDSGDGIPKDLRLHLFDPFFTTKKVGEGTGLGLSITKGIIDSHGGTIKILENHSNTCFELTFPMITIKKTAN